jgi:hypothetical protein
VTGVYAHNQQLVTVVEVVALEQEAGLHPMDLVAELQQAHRKLLS